MHGIAVAWAVFGLCWALLIVLPAPAKTLWFLAVFVIEWSLLLALFALVGIGLAALAWRAGARQSGLLAAILGAVTLALSLLPAAQARATARAEGVPLSLRAYFSGPSFFSDRAPSETVTYARPGGEALRLDVWRPPDAGPSPRPAVVLVHGGNWDSGSRSESPRWDAWLADRGYVVFDVEYRLAPPPRWRDAAGDVKCAFGWVKANAERYGVDPERVALMGSSAGGHLALLAAYTAGDPALPPSCPAPDNGVAAVVALSAAAVLARLFEDQLPAWYPDVAGLDDGGRKTLRGFAGGAPAEVPERYRLASPMSQARRGVPPTLLVHGGRDQIVPPGESRRLAARLRAAGVTQRLLELPYAQHFIELAWGGWGSQLTQPVLLGFLESTVGDGSATDTGGVSPAAGRGR